MNQASRLWLPDHGPAGLIVVARARPLALVVGGRIVDAAPPSEATPETPLRESRTASGLVILSRSARKEPARVVGHPDLATHARFRRGDTLYISIAEAVHRESRGEDVEIHFEPDDADREALAGVAARARRQWEGDQLPDGWMRPRRRDPDPKSGTGTHGDDLHRLAEEIRARRGVDPQNPFREPRPR